MSRLALCLALLCAWTQAARALQLGETKEELLAKHGAPGAEDHAKNLAVYFWEGWSAQLEFKDNVVRKITYRRNWYLQDAEIASLLDANGGAKRWRETSGPNSAAREWTRDDGAKATSGRVRSQSIVFQIASLAALYQEGPKIVATATPASTAVKAGAVAPASASTKVPTFPRPLAVVPEPDLPVADPPAMPQPKPAAAERPVPKLKVEELEPVEKPVLKPSQERAPAAEPSAVAPKEESHLAGYIVGALALLGALVGGGVYFFRRQSRPGHASARKINVTAVSSDAPAGTSGLSTVRNDQVELLVGEIFRREGYTIELSAAVASDDGIDLMLRRDSETTLVQCKHWQSARVTAREAREFYGAMAAGGAPHGILVTTGIFTPDAVEFAAGKGIVLLDGETVASKIAAVAKPAENLCAVSSWLDDFVARARIFDPECPVCHGTMVIHNNRASGAPTWNCRSYPRCPGRREPRLDLIPSTTPHQA
ncbi:MAG: restriction endonuclease [Chthoniobacter sp.]